MLFINRIPVLHSCGHGHFTYGLFYCFLFIFLFFYDCFSLAILSCWANKASFYLLFYLVAIGYWLSSECVPEKNKCSGGDTSKVMISVFF